MNFSVIITVLNEAKSIIPLLDSLAAQSLLPGEIIVVDAGSTDLTKTRIKHWTKEHATIPFQLIELPGSNRSQGRNHGISMAKFSHLAITDAGCECDQHWLKHLKEGFSSDKVEAVAGYYTASATSLVQKLFSLYTVTLPKDFRDESYLPSSRSLAITKTAWEKAGKYPEYLETCEDLVFARDLKESCHMNVAASAIVYWHQATSFRSFYKQLYGYARGDVAASYYPHVAKIITVYIRYTLFALFPLLIILYLFFAPIKFWKETYKDGSFFVLPIVQFVADIAVMFGGIAGLKEVIKREISSL